MMKVYDSKRKLILKAPFSKNRTFKSGIQIGESNCLAVAIEDQICLWHLRFGHLNFRSLGLLKKKGMFYGLLSIKPPKELCEGSFKSNILATKALLEVVYSDVCDPMEFFLLEEYAKTVLGEAVSAIAYILNRSPTKSLNDVIPEEVWLEENLQRKKLDDKGQLMMFLGYDSNDAYKLYITTSKKIVLSKDVIVDKSKDLRELDNHLRGLKIIHLFLTLKRKNMVHLVLLPEIEPVFFEQAFRELEWKVATKEELRAIEKNYTWELVKPTGKVAKYKVRLVANGFLQKCFALVARIETIRLVVVVTIFRGWSLCQLDVKSAFLNEPLEEEVYVCQPLGFEVTRHENKLDFNKCAIEYAFYVSAIASDLIFGIAVLHFGMEFVTTSECIFMHQMRYATDVLKRFHMLDCNSAQTPVDCGIKLEKEGSGKSIGATLYKQVVDSLRFLCGSRSDITYVVGLISRFMDHLRLSHLLATKRILRYVKDILDYVLLFLKHGRSVFDKIYGYCDFDWCGD
ncbi:Copia protein, partial [Mucuna pruriens]